MRISVLLVLSTLIMLACSDSRQRVETEAKEAASPLFDDTLFFPTVYENRAGNIYMNGTPASIERIEERFLELQKSTDALVLYAYPDPVNDLPDNSKVVQLLKKYQVSVKTYYDSTFTKPRY